MAILKKLNKETGQYEEVKNISFGGSSVLSLKDTVGVESAYTTYAMSECADSSSVGTVMTTYTVLDLRKGDSIKTKRQYNGQGGIIKDGDENDLTSQIVWTNYIYGTLTLEQDYETLKVQCENGYENEAKVIKREEKMKNFPSFNDEFVPTINDEESSTLKTLSSQKIYALYGKNAVAMQNVLNGKTVIFMGDSYTKGATTQFATLCEKYGATADNYGIVSSSICGDTTGNKGFQPMWNRTNNVCNSYVDSATTGNVGAVVFMGGANDGLGKDTWLGTGTNDKNTNHIYGAMHSILKSFRNTFDCPIFVILQPYFPNGRTPDTEMTDETAQLLGFESAEQALTFDDKEYCAYSMQKKQAIVKEMAEFYNCKVVDCCFNWHSIFRTGDLSKYWSSDGHPTALGYQEIADYLENAMLEYKW